MAEPALSIVIAVKDGADNVPALLEAIKSRGPETEVILCTAGQAAPAGGDAGQAATAGGDVAQFTFPDDTLVPMLWSEGIKRAHGKSVALTTTQFVPNPRWIYHLQAADLDRWAGVGGAIDNDPHSPARNWAIFFLRYSAFASPVSAGEAEEIAADNAIYDRAAIMEHPDLLKEGFWEPSFHRRFRAAGRKLSIDPELLVVHHGTVRAASFARQRYLHGISYGTERAERSSAGRNLAFLLASPLVPFVLLGRIVSRIAKKPKYRSKLLPAFPWLVWFTLAWATGEAQGYASSLVKRLSGRSAGPSKRHA